MTLTDLMSATTAAKLLAEILKWRLQPWTPTSSITASRTDHDHVSGGGTHGLPFGLDATVDTTWSDGPSGTTTPEGVDKWLRFWNPWMSYWAGIESVFRQTPGPIFLQQLQENPIFRNVSEWDQDDQTAWTDFTDELKAMHRLVARATGNQPKHRGICPECKQGTLRQAAGKHGYDDLAVCSACGMEIPAVDIRSSSQHALRGFNDTTKECWLSGPRIIKIYGGALTWAHLRDWHKQGRLQRKGTRRNYQYSLAQVNGLVLNSQ